MKQKIFVLLLFILFIGFSVFQSIKVNDYRKMYETSCSNNKAYESQIDILQEENKVFQFTIEQLEVLNDKSIKELDSVRKELKIKDSKIKQMGKIKEYVYIVDSIVKHDTIFSEPDFVLDTCLGNEWYTNCLHMEYPDKIQSQTSVNIDQSVFLYTTRETIDPPRKTWLGRLFQRKHDVYNVIVKENNPYATIKENKYIIIDK